jgi:hypothetical protein
MEGCGPMHCVSDACKGNNAGQRFFGRICLLPQLIVSTAAIKAMGVHPSKACLPCSKAQGAQQAAPCGAGDGAAADAVGDL